ncbi:hypothetical protein CXG81DRAFT_19578 [Caulochytrium protostelioides]|uniref:Letm1 RBD domain-containing protein n=1 Tax=Caulochytrium protostelioides TaxID=1555241 RepID=A0A4P9X5P8_9FUNG|nr:hypothetical protein CAUPRSCDRAFT_10553 [Caulochytrium protostelioides]RKP00467.1 hypothetical protein CXG81DRAFT_19578 [Caulochytrium protostelioides]|eukprot:RKP00467.1 hypothetical protein CXG81DRAFT_19578 [Caulochytrium protostelioides]
MMGSAAPAVWRPVARSAAASSARRGISQALQDEKRAKLEALFKNKAAAAGRAAPAASPWRPTTSSEASQQRPPSVRERHLAAQCAMEAPPVEAPPAPGYLARQIKGSLLLEKHATLILFNELKKAMEILAKSSTGQFKKNRDAFDIMTRFKSDLLRMPFSTLYVLMPFSMYTLQSLFYRVPNALASGYLDEYVFGQRDIAVSRMRADVSAAWLARLDARMAGVLASPPTPPSPSAADRVRRQAAVKWRALRAKAPEHATAADFADLLPWVRLEYSLLTAPAADIRAAGRLAGHAFSWILPRTRLLIAGDWSAKDTLRIREEGGAVRLNTWCVRETLDRRGVSHLDAMPNAEQYARLDQLVGAEMAWRQAILAMDSAAHVSEVDAANAALTVDQMASLIMLQSLYTAYQHGARVEPSAAG